jgi:hypothetical protein
MHTATHVCYQNQGEKNKQTSKRRKKSPKTKIAHEFEERSPTKLWRKCPTQNPDVGIYLTALSGTFQILQHLLPRTRILVLEDGFLGRGFVFFFGRVEGYANLVFWGNI